MIKVRHGKIPTWYDQFCKFEETFHKESPNEINTNKTIQKFLEKYKVKNVLDLTCGTGSQVFWLLKRGFNVIGSDISRGMLKIAKQKAKKEKLKATFYHGDMRTTKIGKFDAAITIFNAIGHLRKKDFEKTLRNIHKNLNPGGIYIFDILNLTYVLNHDITKLSHEFIKTIGKTTIREIQHSIIDNKGILYSYTTFYTQTKLGKLKTEHCTATLQLYTSKELKNMLAKNGFKMMGQFGINGEKFSEKKTERILTIAKKQ